MGYRESAAKDGWEPVRYTDAFFVNTFRDDYRRDPAKIIGVKMVGSRNKKLSNHKSNPNALMYMSCFVLEYSDGSQDFIPIGDQCVESRKFDEELITDEDVKKGKIPPPDLDFPFMREERIFGPGFLSKRRKQQ